MNWEAIGAIGEIIGALAVVASLLYLAIQTRANASALRANATWNAETIFGESNYMMGRDPEFAELIGRATKTDAKLEDFTETEIIQVHFTTRGALQYMQAQHSLWKEGALSDEYWKRRLKWTCSYVGLPIINPAWKAEIAQQLVDPDFVEQVELGLKEELVPLHLGKSASGT